MKREDEFLASIYEKRDAALEKRRVRKRLLTRIGTGAISLFAVAFIVFAAVVGAGTLSDRKASGYYGADGENAAEKMTLQENAADPASHYDYASEKAPEGFDKSAESASRGENDGSKTSAGIQPETAAETLAVDVPTGNEASAKEDGTTAAMTVSAGYGDVITERYVEISDAGQTEPDEKRDLETMLTRFRIASPDSGAVPEDYNGNTVVTYKINVSGSRYIFRYNGYYCLIDDPDPGFTARDAIDLADNAINERNK